MFLIDSTLNRTEGNFIAFRFSLYKLEYNKLFFQDADDYGLQCGIESFEIDRGIQ